MMAYRLPMVIMVIRRVLQSGNMAAAFLKTSGSNCNWLPANSDIRSRSGIQNTAAAERRLKRTTHIYLRT